jgi:hypothetical protein
MGLYHILNKEQGILLKNKIFKIHEMRALEFGIIKYLRSPNRHMHTANGK